MRIIDLFKNPFEPHKTPAQVLFFVIVLCLLILPLTSIFVFFAVKQADTDSRASTPISGFSEQKIAEGLSSAVAMQIAPDGRLFVLEQSGNVRVIKNGSLLASPFIHVDAIYPGGNSERGLLGIAFDPNFGNGTDNWVYLYYTTNTSPIHNKVVRVKASTANADVADTSTITTLINLENLVAGNHNGGAIHFGNDGKLYIAVGDNAVASSAQSVSTYLGKILRINKDGTNPGTNPTTFQTSGGAKTVAADKWAIYAIGFRNPFTFDVDEKTGKIFINDVGDNPPVRFEEINELVAGANYGWGAGCQGNTCSDTRYKNPIYSYDPGTQGGCAITGGTFYNPANPKYPADYVGDYLFADFCGGWIKRIEASGGSAQAFTSLISSPVDLKVSSDGYLYYLARGSGEIFKIVHNEPTHPEIDSSAKTVVCEAESASPLNSPMAKATDTNTYVYLNGASNVGDTLPTNTGYAEYSFNIETAGTYVFWAKTNYADSSSNSFWVQFNNEVAINKFGNDNNFAKWHWINYTNGDSTPQVVKVNLAAGANKIRIYGREQNAKVDRWILTTDTLFGPSDSYVGSAQNCALSTNQPPVAQILTPTVGTTWTYSAATPIAYSGSATDPEDGVLPASAYTWQVEFRHDTHPHPHVLPVSGSKTGSFIPNFVETADNIWYRIILTVRDSGGSTTTVSRDIFPIKANVTIASVPTGAKISFDSDASFRTAPQTYVGVVAMPRVFEAVSPQVIASKNYEFLDWSDGGAKKHTIFTPATATTYTARFLEKAILPITGEFKGEYFNNKTLTGTPVATVNTPSINYNWTGSPTAGVNADNFSVRWSGKINFDGSRYRLNAIGDDGLRVFVDGVKVNFVRHPNPSSGLRVSPVIVDSWKDQSPTLYNALILPAAGVHDVVVEYFDSGYGAVAQLNWVRHLTCFDLNADGQVGKPDMDVLVVNYGAVGLSPWDVNPANSVNTVVNSGDQAKLASKYNTSCN